MGKPGVMFYFEIRPCLKRLDEHELNQLFWAIMDYSEYGSEPQLEGMPGMAWDLIRLRLDRDNDRYNRVVTQKAYANYCKKADREKTPRLSYEDWMQEQANISADNAKTLRMVPDGSGWNHPELSGTQTTNHKPQTTNHKPQTTNHKLQTTNHKPYGEPSATPALFSPPDRNTVLNYCREKGIQLDADSFLDYYTANGWMIGKSPMKDWRAAVRRWSRKEQKNEQDGQQWNVGVQV